MCVFGILNHDNETLFHAAQLELPRTYRLNFNTDSQTIVCVIVADVLSTIIIPHPAVGTIDVSNHPMNVPVSVSELMFDDVMFSTY